MRNVSIQILNVKEHDLELVADLLDNIEAVTDKFEYWIEDKD